MKQINPLFISPLIFDEDNNQVGDYDYIDNDAFEEFNNKHHVFTKVIIDSVRKEEPKQVEPTPVQKEKVSPYPTVNEECTFDVSISDYNQLSSAGCEGGYTRYNIGNIVLNEIPLKVSVIYSDKNQIKTGLFINDKKIKSNIDSVGNFKFGIFDNKLFILDKNNGEANAFAFNSEGKEIYNLKTVLENEKVTDLSTGDTYISVKTLNRDTFKFTEGAIEFDSISNSCENGEKSKGSHYKVTYNDEKFEKPEFMELIGC